MWEEINGNVLSLLYSSATKKQLDGWKNKLEVVEKELVSSVAGDPSWPVKIWPVKFGQLSYAN